MKKIAIIIFMLLFVACNHKKNVEFTDRKVRDSRVTTTFSTPIFDVPIRNGQSKDQTENKMLINAFNGGLNGKFFNVEWAEEKNSKLENKKATLEEFLSTKKIQKVNEVYDTGGSLLKYEIEYGDEPEKTKSAFVSLDPYSSNNEMINRILNQFDAIHRNYGNPNKKTNLYFCVDETTGRIYRWVMFYSQQGRRNRATIELKNQYKGSSEWVNYVLGDEMNKKSPYYWNRIDSNGNRPNVDKYQYYGDNFTFKINEKRALQMGITNLEIINYLTSGTFRRYQNGLFDFIDSDGNSTMNGGTELKAFIQKMTQ